MANTTTTVTVTWGNGRNTLLAGTPLDQTGNIANDASAYGILGEDLYMPNRSATVITAGEWDEDEGRLHCGIAVSDAAKEALSAITFNHPVKHYVEAADLATEEKAGLVKQAAAVDDAASAPTKAEFNGLLETLRDAGILAVEEPEPEE